MPDNPIKGEWKAVWGIRDKVGNEQQWQILFHEADGGVSVSLHELDGCASPSEVAATATLIAASKKLLIACRSALVVIESQGLGDSRLAGTLRTAIAKATTVDRSVTY